MFPVKKILCPTDFSDCSYDALKAATQIASNFGAELYLLHVLPDTPHPIWAAHLQERREEFEPGLSDYEEALHESAQQKLHEVIGRLIPKEVKSHGVVIKGDAASEIARFAEDERMGLIVISTHGMRCWRQVTLGSVAERVVRISSRPVLTIRSQGVK